MPVSCLYTTVTMLLAAAAAEQEPVTIGGRLELLVDQHVAETLRGVELRLHQPVRRELVFRTDAPWEGNASAFQSLVRDGDRYLMYYRGLHYRHSGPAAQALADHPWYLCRAESTDGVHWTRPELGVFEIGGSRANNVVLTPEAVREVGGDPAHTAVFLDTNPACPPDARFKCAIVGSQPKGLYFLGSPDGIRFRLLSTTPAVTEGAFDSQNLAFWDPVAACYREYHRGFKDGVRAILTASSPDLLRFPAPTWLQYEDSPAEHLYTNQVQPYLRAPHLLVGFPLRYTERGWSAPVLALPGLEERLVRGQSHPRYGYAVTDALFMSSRDGLTFKRWGEAFIRPGPRQRESWVYGDNFVFWGLVETASAIEDAPPELSIYTTESYWEGVGTAVRRSTLRLDGFVSAHAPLAGGELVTRPVVFEGGNLTINAETSGAGGIQVELQGPDGRPLEGYALAECPPILGDSVRHVVRWEGPGGDLRPLAGRPVRLRFVLRDADLYAFQFVPYEPEPTPPSGLLPGLLPKKQAGRGRFVVVDGGLDVLPTAGEASGWVVRAGSPDRVRLLNDEPPGSGQPAATGYLRIERRNEGHHEGGALWLRLSPQDAADTTGSVVEVTARVWVPSSNPRPVDLDAYDNPVGEFTRRAFHLRIAPDGQVMVHRETDRPVAGLRCPPDTWQEIRLRADFTAGTFDVTMGGQTVTGLPFAMDGVRRMQSLFCGPNAANTALCLSRCTVAVEP